MKISMSGIMFDARPLEEAVEAAAKIGYEGIEIRARKDKHLPPTATKEGVKEIQGLCRRHGLAVTGIASFTGGYGILSDEECARELADFQRYVDRAQDLACDQVRHWAAWKASREATAAEWDRAVAWLRKAAEYAAPRGVKVALEMHHNTFVDTNARALRILRDVGMPNVVLIHDAANLYHDGSPYGAEALFELRGLLGNVHCKDVVALADKSDPAAFEYRGRTFRHCLIGRGGVDQHSVVKGLRAIGYEGPVTVESSGLLAPYELAEYSFREVKNLLAQRV
jgi:sugar phosphate isomerase/epimerase